jgi:hypothetical protein
LGGVPPGCPLSLKEIASARHVRVTTLVEVARSLEHERLITLRGKARHVYFDYLMTLLRPDATGWLNRRPTDCAQHVVGSSATHLTTR